MKSYDTGTNAYVVKRMSIRDYIEAIREIELVCAFIDQLPGTTESKR